MESYHGYLQVGEKAFDNRKGGLSQLENIGFRKS